MGEASNTKTEPLKDKIREAPDSIIRGRPMDHRDVFLKEDVAAAVEWLHNELERLKPICVSPEFYHGVHAALCRAQHKLKQAFPDVYPVEVEGK